MALDRLYHDSRLQVRYRVGYDEEDEPIYRLRTLARVRWDSPNQDLYNVANSIAGLQQYFLTEVRVSDSSELIEVE